MKKNFNLFFFKDGGNSGYTDFLLQGINDIIPENLETIFEYTADLAQAYPEIDTSTLLTNSIMDAGYLPIGEKWPQVYNQFQNYLKNRLATGQLSPKFQDQDYNQARGLIAGLKDGKSRLNQTNSIQPGAGNLTPQNQDPVLNTSPQNNLEPENPNQNPEVFSDDEMDAAYKEMKAEGLMGQEPFVSNPNLSPMNDGGIKTTEELIVADDKYRFDGEGDPKQIGYDAQRMAVREVGNLKNARKETGKTPYAEGQKIDRMKGLKDLAQTQAERLQDRANEVEDPDEADNLLKRTQGKINRAKQLSKAISRRELANKAKKIIKRALRKAFIVVAPWIAGTIGIIMLAMLVAIFVPVIVCAILRERVEPGNSIIRGSAFFTGNRDNINEFEKYCGGEANANSCPAGTVAWVRGPNGEWVKAGSEGGFGASGPISAGVNNIPTLPVSSGCKELDAFLRAIIYKESVLTPNPLVPGPEGVFYWRYPSTPFAKQSPQPHPDIIEPGPRPGDGPSNAAGAFQFLSDSYYLRIKEIPELYDPLDAKCKALIDESTTRTASKQAVKDAANCVDFSPLNQTKAAFQYLRNLKVEDILCNGDSSDASIERAVNASNITWVSLPGGSQQTITLPEFIQVYRQLLAEETGSTKSNQEANPGSKENASNPNQNFLRNVAFSGVSNPLQFLKPIRAEAQSASDGGWVYSHGQGSSNVTTDGRVRSLDSSGGIDFTIINPKTRTTPVQPGTIPARNGLIGSGNGDHTDFRITRGLNGTTPADKNNPGVASGFENSQTVKTIEDTEGTQFAIAEYQQALRDIGSYYGQNSDKIVAENFTPTAGSSGGSFSGSGPVLCCPPGVTPSGDIDVGGASSIGNIDIQYTREGQDFSLNAEQKKNFETYKADIEKYAAKYNLDPTILAAKLMQESSFRTEVINGSVRSSQGAVGFSQFIPDTLEVTKNSEIGGSFGSEKINPGYSVQDILDDPAKGIELQARYVRYLMNKYDNDYAKAIAAYNFGEGRIDGGEKLPEETRDYVIDVNENSKRLGGPGFPVPNNLFNFNFSNFEKYAKNLREMFSPLEVYAQEKLNLQEIASRSGADYIVVTEVETGKTQSFNGSSLPKSPASTIKIAVAEVVLNEIRKGNIRLDEVIQVTDSDEADGETYSSFTVREALNNMLKDSGNTSTNALVRRVGGAGVSALVAGRDSRVNRLAVAYPVAKISDWGTSSRVYDQAKQNTGGDLTRLDLVNNLPANRNIQILVMQGDADEILLNRDPNAIQNVRDYVKTLRANGYNLEFQEFEGENHGFIRLEPLTDGAKDAKGDFTDFAAGKKDIDSAQSSGSTGACFFAGSSGTSSGSSTFDDGELVFPVNFLYQGPGPKQGFGTARGRLHPALDFTPCWADTTPGGVPWRGLFANYPETSVYAVTNGTVISTGGGLGIVVIEHPNHPRFSTSSYLHNARILVSEGQQVSAGQKIAEIGSIGGGSTAPHLDLRIKDKEGKWIDITSVFLDENKNPKAGLKVNGNPRSACAGL